MLETLDEMGLQPSVIAGTSIGALLGGAYALGLPGRHIRAMAEETLGGRFDLARQVFAARSDPVQKLLRLLPVRSALLSSRALLDLLVPEFADLEFDDLQIPLKVTATDLSSQEAVLFECGALAPAIAASVAIPVLFQPVRHQGRVLVDGGLVNPLPFEVLADDVDITIAIDVSGASKLTDISAAPSAMEVALQSVQILQKSITRQKLAIKRPDIYIDVAGDRFGALEFWRPREILAAAAPLKDRLRRELDHVLETRRCGARTG